MKKNTLVNKILFMFLIIVLATDCSSTHNNKPIRIDNNVKIQIFGNPVCPHCNDFTARLKEENIPYKYVNVVEPENKKKLWKLLKKHKPEVTSVPLPVIFVKNQLFLRPKFSKVMKLLEPRS